MNLSRRDRLEELEIILKSLGFNPSDRELIMMLYAIVKHRLAAAHIPSSSARKVLRLDKWYILGIMRRLQSMLNSLDDDQLNAVYAMINPPPNQNYLVLVIGPPGTGKTRVTALGGALFSLKHPDNKVIITATSHYACDCALRYFIDMGFDKYFVQRIIPYTFNDYANKYGAGYGTRDYYMEWPGTTFISRQTMRFLSEVVKVYIVTLDSLDRLRFLGRGNVMLVMEEISQIDEAKLFTVLANLDKVPLSHIVFVGDPEQLYNITSQPQLRMSCIRLLKAGPRGPSGIILVPPQQPLPEYRLQTQYRMDEEICNLVNFIRTRFLGTFSIRTSPSVRNNLIQRAVIRFWPSRLGFNTLDGLVNPLKTVVIVDTSHIFDAHNQTENRYSIQPLDLRFGNRYEAALLTGLTNLISECLDNRWLLNERVVPKLRIMAPYKDQVSLIRSNLRNYGISSIRTVVDRIVTTIDSMQGKECEIAVISLTRQNLGGFIGFLGEIERLYVAMSRAKKKLILVGHLDTFYTSGQIWWRQLVNYLRQRPNQSHKAGLITIGSSEYQILLNRYRIPVPQP